MDIRAIGPELTILSYGGGQDSTALLWLYINDASFRAKYAPNRFIVVMSATGAEHPDTDEYVKSVAKLCADRGIEFYHLGTQDGFHTGAWTGGLIGQWETHNTIGSAAYPKSCTDSLKIKPIWKFVESYVAREYGYTATRKQGLKDFVRDFGKIRCIIGIAKGEESRVAVSAQTTFGFVVDKTIRDKWFIECVDKVYPLIELGFDRAKCQAYISASGAAVPPPSNCWACPYKSRQEVLWTKRIHPDLFAKWLALEAAKLAKWEGVLDTTTGEPIPNYGVKGTTLLAEYAEEAEKLYGHWTIAELEEYRFSHGHCVASKY